MRGHGHHHGGVDFGIGFLWFLFASDILLTAQPSPYPPPPPELVEPLSTDDLTKIAFPEAQVGPGESAGGMLYFEHPKPDARFLTLYFRAISEGREVALMSVTFEIRR